MQIVQNERRGRRRYLFFDKNLLKKKRRGRELQGVNQVGDKKKEEFRKGHAAKRDARRPKTRSKRSRTERSTIATPAFRRFFFPSLCFHPLRAERLARGKKERAHFKGVFLHMPHSPFELSLLRKTERNIFPLFLFQIPLTTTTHNNNNNNAL